jgi:hypothetical protein
MLTRGTPGPRIGDAMEGAMLRWHIAPRFEELCSAVSYARDGDSTTTMKGFLENGGIAFFNGFAAI